MEGGPGGHHVQHPGQAHDHRQLQHDQELAGQPLAGAVWDIELSINIREGSQLSDKAWNCETSRRFVRSYSIYTRTQPALSRYLYTPCFNVLHLPPVAAQSYPGQKEAADVDGDEGGHDEVVVEELRGLGEAQLGLVFGLDEALDDAHVGSGGLARPHLVHQSCYDGEHNWEALCIQTIQ